MQKKMILYVKLMSPMCFQLQLEDDRVVGVPGGRAAEPTRPSPRQPDRLVWGRDPEPRGVLRPEQRWHTSAQPRLAAEQRRWWNILINVSLLRVQCSCVMVLCMEMQVQHEEGPYYSEAHISLNINGTLQKGQCWPLIMNVAISHFDILVIKTLQRHLHHSDIRIFNIFRTVYSSH